MSKLKLLIVEDEPLVAEDIAGAVEDLGYHVVGIAYSGEEAVEMLKSGNPDAALLDITLSGKMDGIDVANFINDEIEIPFIFLTSHSDHSTLQRAKETMPSAYLLKPFDEKDLLTTLEISIYNHLNIKPEKEASLDTINEKLPNPLSERELNILELLKLGRKNQEIADESFLSVNTIKTHLLRIYEKLDASNRTEALFKLNNLLKK